MRKTVKDALRNTFYRPEEIDTRKFCDIVDKMKSDLEALITGQATRQETKEYVEKLIHDGEPLDQQPDWIVWKLDEPENMPSDARVDFLYMPTYIAAAFMTKAVLLYPEFLEEIPNMRKILQGALLACTGREFAGHGIEAIDDRLNAIKLFLNADMHTFLKQYPNICPDFAKLFNTTMRDIIRH